jgi:hypothetical protein
MLRLYLAIALFWCGLVVPAGAEEIIRSFHSEVSVASDGELTVTETISVVSEGRDIRRGIFRDFPLEAVDARGRTIRVGFDVLSVTRDGKPEPWRTEPIEGGVRIYTGLPEALLPRGEHVYVITYRTDRQIRFFEEHDELYWNVTGNGWIFSVGQASARVTLPTDASVAKTQAFTGAIGSINRQATIRRDGNIATFSAKHPLRPNEGLTVVVGFSKGHVAPPSGAQQSAWWLRDNINPLLGFGGLLLVVLYYTFSWTRAGRDPAEGVMVPRWDPPEACSPALVNYIANKGFVDQGWTALSATALDLAVKGYVQLEDLKHSVTIRRTEKAAEEHLPTSLQILLKEIVAPGAEIVIDKAHGEQMQRIGRNFRTGIENEHRGRYYRANTLYVIGGLLLSIVALGVLFLLGNVSEDLFAVLLVPAVAALAFGSLAGRFGKGLRRNSSLYSKITSIVALSFLGLVALSMISSIVVMMIPQLTGSGRWPLLVSIGGIVLVNVIFYFLMGAPTPIGRKLMDHIEGLKTYLTLAEEDRMNLSGVPVMSPPHFEKLLPYAVALGVEKPWTQLFEKWLANAATAATAPYSSGWYSGDSVGSLNESLGELISSMASRIASTIPAPKVSSASSGFSRGGGFSGGGAGGGGGGGW